MGLCECGCGQEAGSSSATRKNRSPRFLSGHNIKVTHPMQGKTHTVEARRKIRSARKRQVNVGGPRPGFRGTPDERFDSKLFVEPNTGCHLWVGGLTSKSYGVFSAEPNKVMPAHRYAYRRAKGLIPVGLEIDHLCSTPPCVNPDHLEAVTHTENLRRARVRRQRKE